jgi:GTP-binding protein
LAYKYNKHIKAPNGEMGMSRDRYGKDGQDVVLEVPVGTIVKDAHTKKLIFQCLEDGQQCVLCRGGKGGTGNMHFANSTRQYPNFALQGEPAEIMDVELELQLLGDCALIGTPSVGKSTIINMVSNVKAKVADYPFTTLVPNLGTVVVNDYSFIIVDIP